MYNFGEFSLDPNNVSLHKNETPIAIEPQVFHLLVLLIENRHRILMKEELVATIWKGRVVSDSAISSRIKSARQAIGDDGKKQQWIKTIHGFGFRFVGDIKQPNKPTNSADDNTPPSDINSPQQFSNSRPSIVVLPMKTGQNHTELVFAEGIAHDIITSLSRLRWLKVISRTSAFQLSYSHSVDNAQPKMINAKYCVSGFLSRHNNAVKVNMQLDDLHNDSVLWADSISFAAAEVEQLRSDIVYRIINHLEIQISEHEAQLAMFKSSESLNAWEAYHLGLSHFFRYTQKDNQVAVNLFSKAVSIDPSFARAHAGLSSAAFQNAFNEYKGIEKTQSVEQMVSHAEKSFALDKMDPLANFVMGRTHWLVNDPFSSLPWLERAIALNPNFAQGYYARGLASLLSNDGQRGYEDSDRALELSPLDPLLYGFQGIRAFSYLADDDLESACLWAEKSAQHPEALAVMSLLAAATCNLTQRDEKAKVWLQKARQFNPNANSQLFFSALPFVPGKINQLLRRAFKSLKV